MAEEKEVFFRGYRVTRDGKIFSKTGYQVTVNKNTGFMRYQTTDKNGKKISKSMMAGRFVYMAFTGQNLTQKHILQFRDGDITNVALDNLYIVERKSLISSYDEEKKFTPEIEEQIRKEYNLEERKAHGFKGEWSVPSYKDLATKYGCCKSTIYKILRHKY